MLDRSNTYGGLLGGLAGDFQDLFKGEILLARAELEEKLHRLGFAAVWLLGGALVAFAGLVVMLEGAAAALASVLPDWAALLIVGAIIIIVGGIVAFSGLGMLSIKAFKLNRTSANLHEDARLLKDRAS